MCMSVDFPDPEGPMIATNSPSLIVNETPFNALNSLSDPWEYVFVILVTWIIRDYRPPVSARVAPDADRAPPVAPLKSDGALVVLAVVDVPVTVLVTISSPFESPERICVSMSSEIPVVTGVCVGVVVSAIPVLPVDTGVLDGTVNT